MQRAIVFFSLAGVLSCASSKDPSEPLSDAAGGAAGGSSTYTPTHADIDQAAALYPDFGALWQKGLYVSCGPNNGVCHQNKQFPHMELSSSLLDVIDQPCNQLRDNRAAITNLCEPKGDLLAVGDLQTRVGSVSASPPDNPTSVTLTVEDPLPSGADPASLSFVRKRDGLSTAVIPIPASAVSTIGSQSVTFDYATLANKYTSPAPGVGASLADFLLPKIYIPHGDELQIELGDPNADGVFGSELGGAILKPGEPLKSYLMLRVLGPLDFGQSETSSLTAPATEEAQMPIANAQYWDADHTIVALWCWLSSMSPDGSNAEAPIDYAHCDTSSMPPIVKQGGEASTFSSIYRDILRPRCSSCHNSNATGTSLSFDDPSLTYSVLLGISGGGPSETKAMPYVTRNEPDQSYLFLKITGDPTAGPRMPLNADPLPDSAIDAVRKWIEQGATDN